MMDELPAVLELNNVSYISNKGIKVPDIISLHVCVGEVLGSLIHIRFQILG